MKQIVVWEHTVRVSQSGKVLEEKWTCLDDGYAAWLSTAAVCIENLESALIHAVEEPSYASWYVEIALEWSAMLKRIILERLDAKH